MKLRSNRDSGHRQRIAISFSRNLCRINSAVVTLLAKGMFCKLQDLKDPGIKEFIRKCMLNRMTLMAIGL